MGDTKQWDRPGALCTEMWMAAMLFCMRTTLDLDDQVLGQAKRVAQEKGMTLTSFIEDALRERLARRTDSGKRSKPFKLHTFKGHGLQPGVDLDNSEQLRDIMDGLA